MMGFKTIIASQDTCLTNRGSPTMQRISADSRLRPNTWCCPERANTIRFDVARHGLSVRLLRAARGKPRAAPFCTSCGGAAPFAKASITTRAADVHGRC